MWPDSEFSPTLDAAFDYVEWKNWRSKVNKHFVKLNDRISLLEDRCMDGNIQEATKQISLAEIRFVDTKKPLRTTKEVTSAKDTMSSFGQGTKTKGEPNIRSQKTESFAESDYLGIGCLSTFVAVARSKIHAKIQFIVLVIFILLFLMYGQSTLYRAIDMEQSDFKPEKKSYSLNYGDSNNFLEYQLPYIYLDFLVILRNTTYESVNRTILKAQLLKYLNHFNESIFFRHYDLSVSYPRVSLSFLMTGEGVRIGSDFGVYVTFEIKVYESPTRWGWYLYVPVEIDLSSFIKGSFVDSIRFGVTRDQYSWEVPLMLDWDRTVDEMVDMFMIGFKETITRKHQSFEWQSTFDVTWSRTKWTLPYFFAASNITASDSWLLLQIQPNSEVEHWGEFVAFGYNDWLAGMGGLFSLMTTGFFLTSYHIAKCCGDGISMGILPPLSFNLRSYEEVKWIKNRLGKSGVL